MVARIRLNPSCSDIAWQSLLLSMNSIPDKVVVPTAMLDEVLDHHIRLRQDKPDLDIQYAGKKYYTVDRRKLMAFVTAHGKVCEK